MHDLDLEIIGRTLPYLFGQGLVFTVRLTVLSACGALVLGTVLALMRLSSNALLSGVAAGYVNGMRALPLILIIFWFYFLVPYIAGWLMQAQRPIAVGGFASALITFVLFEAAYFCEIIRAGIQSIARGQAQAGYALGMRYGQVMGSVILPQAFRNMLPLLLMQMIIIFQDTSMVYVLSLTDFLGAASNIAHRDGRLVEMFVFAALVYFVLSWTASRLVRRLERRLAAPR